MDIVNASSARQNFFNISASITTILSPFFLRIITSSLSSHTEFKIADKFCQPLNKNTPSYLISTASINVTIVL